jgi:hypothetical protein
MAVDPARVETLPAALLGMGLSVLSIAHATRDSVHYVGLITDVVDEQRMTALLPQIAALPCVLDNPALIRLDKDNYRDIVEREQSAYFGASLQRQPGAGV